MHVPEATRHHKRQAQGSIPALPTVAGISGGATVIVTETTATGLVINSDTLDAPAQATAPAFVPGSSIAVTTTLAPSSTPASATASATVTAVTASSSQIPLGTVIGACVAALVAALILISAGVWYYRRTLRKVKNNKRTRPPLSPLVDAANNRGDSNRRSSKLEPWSKLGEKEAEGGDVDVWQGMVPEPSTKGVIFPTPAKTRDTTSPSMEKKLGGMFNKDPSVRSTDKDSVSAYSALDFGDTLAESAQFAKYHPHLAEELAKTVTPARPEPARQQNGPISWDGETVNGDDNTFMSLRSRIDSHLSSASEALSPSFVKVNSTPTAMSNTSHRWESAEVMHYDNDDSDLESRNPFSELASESRKSLNNPFFNAQSQPPTSKRLASNPMDPFADSARSPHFKHNIDDSVTSLHSDRAMQSLIAALNVSPEDVHERLRVASMQSVNPSLISSSSALEDDTSVAEFPLPPTQVPRA